MSLLSFCTFYKQVKNVLCSRLSLQGHFQNKQRLKVEIVSPSGEKGRQDLLNIIKGSGPLCLV